MPTVSRTSYVAGQAAKAATANTNESGILSAVNGNLDRTNVKTIWVQRPITRRFYFDAAAGTSQSLNIILPSTNDYTDARFTALGFHRSTTTNARTLTLYKYTLPSGANVATLETVAIAGATTDQLVDSTVAAITPASYGLRATYAASTGTFEAGEYIDVDVWVASQICAVTEL